MPYPSLRCVLCRRPLAVRAGEFEAPPPGCLLFYSRGADGSEVYDPGESQADLRHLVLGVCDPCLRVAGERGDVAYGEMRPRLGEVLPGQWSYRTWRLPTDEEEREPGA